MSIIDAEHDADHFLPPSTCPETLKVDVEADYKLKLSLLALDLVSQNGQLTRSIKR